MLKPKSSGLKGEPPRRLRFRYKLEGAGIKGFPLDPPLLLILKGSGRTSWGKKMG